MSLRGAIARLASGTYTVTRRAQGHLDGHGRYLEDGATSTFEIVASAQPITGKTLGDGSEGQTGNERMRFFTRTKLVARDKNTQPDVIAYADDDGTKGDYEVDTVKTHRSFGDVHYIVDATYTGSP